MKLPNDPGPSESSDETLKTALPHAQRQSLQRLRKQMGRWTMAAAAGGIITWSVFNLSLNLLAFRADTNPDSNWLIALAMALLTCVGPLLIGFWMLTQALGETPDKP